MAKEPTQFDLYTFVSGDAVENGHPFSLKCNCGGVVTIMPPFQDEYVFCPLCESTIKMILVQGDPGYIVGADPDGSPRLLPVQGSAHPHPSTMSPEELKAVLSKVEKQLEAKESKNGNPR